MSDKIKREIYTWIVVIAIVLFLRQVFVESYVIPTPSMERTLLIGDALLVNRFVYGIKFPYTKWQILHGKLPDRGDIVVFRYPYENKDFVKRCLGVGGDTVEIKNKILYVNGERKIEPYVYYGDNRVFPAASYDSVRYQHKWEQGELADIFGISVRDNFGPIVVPKDHIFVMGDNRDDSMDSRFWGPLHRSYLKGKPLFIYFSFDPGGPAETIFDIIRFWRWRAIRFGRIGHVT